MKPSIAIVGAETLIGRELIELAGEQALPADIRQISTEDEQAAILTQRGDEVTVLTPLGFHDLGDATAVFLAGSRASSERALDMLRREKSRAPIVDLTYDALPGEGRLRAPAVDNLGQAQPGVVTVLAHPAAAAIALLVSRLAKLQPVRHVVVHVFEPASERGTAGVEELEQQTVSLLSMKEMPKQVFDEQVSFNLVPKWGPAASGKLELVEERIRAHTRQLLEQAGIDAQPAIRLIQAPVFHGYACSVWVEFAAAPEAGRLRSVLEGPYLELTAADEMPRNNISVAGASAVSVGPVTPDPGNPNALWFWMVADNLRFTGLNALELVRGVILTAQGAAGA